MPSTISCFRSSVKGREKYSIFLRYAGGAHTNADIASALNLRINEITPRTFELRKFGLVLDAGRRTCRITGNTAHQWKAKYPVLPEAFPEKPKEESINSLF